MRQAARRMTVAGLIREPRSVPCLDVCQLAGSGTMVCAQEQGARSMKRRRASGAVDAGLAVLAVDAGLAVLAIDAVLTAQGLARLYSSSSSSFYSSISNYYSYYLLSTRKPRHRISCSKAGLQGLSGIARPKRDLPGLSGICQA